jgi:LysM repeat protein
MNNLKTAFVVVVMLAVLYGVYLVLNKPEPVAVQGTGETPWESATRTMPEIGLGTPFVPPAAPEGSRYSGANESPARPNAPWSGPASGPAPGPETQPGPIPYDKNSPDLLEPRGPYAKGSLTDENAFPDGDEMLSSRSQPPARDGDSLARAPSQEDEYRRDEDPRSRQDTAGESTGETGGETTGETGEESANDSIGTSAFSVSWAEAQQMVRDGKFRQALALLTPYYGNSDLAPEEQRQLEEMLDSLAGKVIYSTEHWMEAPYAVESGETLREIAEEFDVPWELLQNINGIEDPNAISPGDELKVVRGPFRAEIELSRNRLTLFAKNLYAGRFDIEVHERDAPLIGRFSVNSRRLWPNYESRGETIEANHPDNPYGQWLIDLGGGVSLHSHSPSPTSAALGCISLSPQDASDVFGILSVGSQVEIRR